MSKAEYTDYLIGEPMPRAMSTHWRWLPELVYAAEQDKIQNISFVTGNAMYLPYDDGVFDLVITRHSLHHFTEPEKLFCEMQRVLKSGGKLVIWEMEATAEELRETNDAIEKMRDDSHTHILSREEFETI